MNGIPPAALESSIPPVFVRRPPDSARPGLAQPNAAPVGPPEQSSVLLLDWGQGSPKEEQVGTSIFKRLREQSKITGGDSRAEACSWTEVWQRSDSILLLKFNALWFW